MSAKLLITPNALINLFVSARNPSRIYLYSFQQLVEQIENQRVSLYMTEFDFFVAFILTKLFKYDSTHATEGLRENIITIPINENVLDTASILTINPSDAVRVGAVIEHCLDGAITWEPDHFLPSFGLNGMSSCCCYHRIKYEGLAESGDPKATDTPDWIEIDVFSVNGFLLYYADKNPPELSSINYQEYKTQMPRWRITKLECSTNTSNSSSPHSKVSVEIMFGDGEYDDQLEEGPEGLVETAIKAINQCVMKHFKASCDPASIDAIEIAVPPVLLNEGWGEVLITLTTEGHKFFGRGYQHDFLRATADAYLNALAAVMNGQVLRL